MSYLIHIVDLPYKREVEKVHSSRYGKKGIRCAPKSKPTKEEMKKINSPHADLVRRIFSFMQRRSSEFGGDAPNLHDVIALASMVAPNLFTMKDYYITVELNGDLTRGMTVADFRNVTGKTPNIHAAIDIDIDGFWKWFTDVMYSSQTQY